MASRHVPTFLWPLWPLFCLQERASKQLPGPGQHFSFGAVKPWEDILAMLDERDGEQQPTDLDIATRITLLLVFLA
jgi:hypothetical protein